MTEPVQTDFYPLLFEPVLKDYIWGGRNLATRLGRRLPEGKEIAESWEIAAHPHGDVTVRNGPLAGQRLSQLVSHYGQELAGTRAEWALERDAFPLLIKLLDANRALSVQVHPDDEYARVHEGNELGKTEMWVVLHAEEDASVILGVKQGTTAELFRQAIHEGRLEPHLHEIRVSTGDFVCVPSGSLHAIKGGLLIAEIQQNSDVTYRVYDWNRREPGGKTRVLHVSQAMDVIDFSQVEPSLPTAELLTPAEDVVQRWELCRNPYFVVERVEIPSGETFTGACDGSSLQVWGALSGSAAITGGGVSVALPAVAFTLLPARLGDYQIAAPEGPVQLLRAYLQ